MISGKGNLSFIINLYFYALAICINKKETIIIPFAEVASLVTRLHSTCLYLLY